MSDLTETMRILTPYPGIFAYYDGRITGKRLHSEEENWLDDGAYTLGIAAYALVEGAEAVLYDTHMTLAHARFMRGHLESLGVTSIRVVLSHWHTDHVAGNEVFADCEIIALGLTAQAMEDNREKLEQGSPPIFPLVFPTRLFDGRLDVTLGGRKLELHHFNIHSADGCVIWLPDDGLLLAGDTLEDTVTYICEPENLETHIAELTRMESWPIRRILPNHGDPARIAAGGYDKRLIRSNRAYLERLLDPADRRAAAETPLADFMAEDCADGGVIYFDAYEPTHRRNVATVEEAMGSKS